MTTGTVSDTDGTVSDTAGTVSDTEGTVSDTAGTVSDTEGTVRDPVGTVSDTDVLESNFTVSCSSIHFQQFSGKMSSEKWGKPTSCYTPFIPGQLYLYELLSYRKC
jgi:uncharacterized protein YjbJ (UPF0337 family)